MNMFKRWYDADAVVSKAIRFRTFFWKSYRLDVQIFIIDLLKDVELKELSLDDQYNYIKCDAGNDKNVKVSHAVEYLRLSPDDADEKPH